MFRLINSLQVVALFVGMPWLIGWLWTDPFWRADYLGIAACFAYAGLCILMTSAVFHLSEDWK